MKPRSLGIVTAVAVLVFAGLVGGGCASSSDGVGEQGSGESGSETDSERDRRRRSPGSY